MRDRRAGGCTRLSRAQVAAREFHAMLAGEVTCHVIRLTDLTFARISTEQTRSEQEVLNAGRDRYRSWATRA